jgi:hypothetical protein
MRAIWSADAGAFSRVFGALRLRVECANVETERDIPQQEVFERGFLVEV